MDRLIRELRYISDYIHEVDKTLSWLLLLIFIMTLSSCQMSSDLKNTNSKLDQILVEIKKK